MRRWPDIAFYIFTGIVGVSILVLAALLLFVLADQSVGAFRAFGVAFLWGSTWAVTQTGGVFGVLPFVYGTLITSAIALMIGIPLGLGSAIFLTTHAPRWVRESAGTAINLLAAIPSVIFGLWGFWVVRPYMKSTVEPGLQQYLGWTHLFGGTPTGSDLLTAGVVLGIMVVPTISAVSRETLAAVPAAQREAALSLGATDWEMTRLASIPYARVGIIGGIILGLGRALGETMAVIMLVGDANVVPKSLLSQGQTIAGLIATELTSNNSNLQVDAILGAGLVLLLIAILVNAIARLLVRRVLRIGGEKLE